MPSWKHLRTILLLPGMVTIAIPGSILWLGSGLVLALSTIRLFLAVGEGTIAPWDPPQRLVVRGIYRHFRNPR